MYSSIDNNRIPYNFVKINVAEYFGDCIEEIGADLESKSVKLNYSNLTTPDTQIVADPEQIKRVINNVVNNSVKYLDRDDGSTDASRNSKQGGSGIGLSIVKKIIEDHGGYIWATSHEGEGTCMHFVLRKYIEFSSGAETVTVDHENL